MVEINVGSTATVSTSAHVTVLFLLLKVEIPKYKDNPSLENFEKGRRFLFFRCFFWKFYISLRTKGYSGIGKKKGTRPQLNENKPGLTISNFPTGYTIFSEVFLTFAKFWVRPRSKSIQIDTALLLVNQCNKFHSNITNQQIWTHQRIRLFLQQQGFA